MQTMAYSVRMILWERGQYHVHKIKLSTCPWCHHWPVSLTIFPTYNRNNILHMTRPLFCCCGMCRPCSDEIPRKWITEETTLHRIWSKMGTPTPSTADNTMSRCIGHYPLLPCTYISFVFVLGITVSAMANNMLFSIGIGEWSDIECLSARSNQCGLKVLLSPTPYPTPPQPLPPPENKIKQIWMNFQEIFSIIYSCAEYVTLLSWIIHAMLFGSTGVDIRCRVKILDKRS